MKTSALTLLMALLGAFALQASPDLTANVRLDSLMKNDTLINAPAMKAETKTDSGQTIMNPMQSNEKDSTTFEQVINVLNFMFAIAALVIAIISFCVAVKSLRVAFFSFRYTNSDTKRQKELPTM